MKHSIRPYHPDDIDSILKLFWETVHAINRKHYSPAQLNAWAPQALNREKWASGLEANFTFVCHQEGTITGFADIDNTGYFDHLFVHKDFQRQGIATMLANAIESDAVANSFSRVTVAAWLTAKPFFKKRGYIVLKEQQIERNGEVLTNFLMELAIQIPDS